MPSGIGPQSTLSKFKIPIITENEHVGRHLINGKSVSLALPMLKALVGDDTNIMDVAAFTDDVWISTTHKNAIGWANALQECVLCGAANRTEQCKEQIYSALLLFGMNRQISPPYLAVNVIFQRYPKVRGNATLSSNDFNDPPILFDGWDRDFENLSSSAKKDLAA